MRKQEMVFMECTHYSLKLQPFSYDLARKTALQNIRYLEETGEPSD